MSDEGRKDDSGKDPWHLLPTDAMRGVVKVLAKGAARYGERNWERGMAWSRCYAALHRHVSAWWEGESVDAETGLSHLDHALCCLMFLSAYEKRAIGTNDRPHHLSKAMREQRADEAAVAAMRALIGQDPRDVKSGELKAVYERPAQEDAQPDLLTSLAPVVGVSRDALKAAMLSVEAIEAKEATPSFANVGSSQP